MTEFRLLGPLEVLRDGHPVKLGGDRQRALLAFLLVHANEFVSSQRIVAELLGDDPSGTGTNALQATVSRLRRILEDGPAGNGGEQALVTERGGYILRTPPEQLDVTRFERLAADGRRALERGDADVAAGLLREALALWRGPAFADLALLDFVQGEMRRLEELRLSATADRIDADLALGQGAELVGELEALVEANPFQERFRGQLMLALYRSGRQAEALEAYRQARQYLSDELGLEPSRALQNLERAILTQDPELDTKRAPPAPAASPAPDVCPFKGLAYFEVADAEYFFGRERTVDELVSRAVDTGFLGVGGPSGNGKSSILRAGLVASLAAGRLPGSQQWQVRVLRPGEHPAAALEQALGGVELDSVLAGLTDGERLVLAVDQLEEVFTQCGDEEERTGFLAQLAAAATDRSRRALVAVALRGDFYDRFAAYHEFAELLSRNHVLVGPMDPREIRRAITLPSSRAGLEVEPALADALVADVAGEPGGLPLLSTMLLQLWRARDEAVLSYASYRASGGVQAAVAALAEDAYGRLSPAEQPAARSVMLRLVGGDEDRPVRRRVPLQELERIDGGTRVVDELVDARLLTVGDGEVEVAHEALLREWPRFRDWFAESRDERRLRAHLAAGAREWESRGRDAAELYRGARLAAVVDLASRPNADLSDVEREFVEAGRAESERELTRQRKHNRRLRGALAGIGILLLIAVAAGAAALVSRSNAQHEATVALARQLGAEAVAEPRIDTAMLLARESLNLDHSSATQGTLLATLLRSPAALATFAAPISSRPQRVALSPDGKTLAAADNTASVRFYDTAGRRLRATVHDLGHGQPPAYTPDGSRFVAFGGATSPLLDLRDAKTNRIIRQLRFDKQWLTKPSDNGGDLLVEPDGRTVLWAYGLFKPDGSPGTDFVDRWDLAAGKLVSTTPIGGAGVLADQLVDHGRELAVFTAANRVIFVNATTLRPVHTFVAPKGSGIVGDETISPDGRRLAVGTGAGTVIFVDVATGKRTDGQGAHPSAIASILFSPDGSKLVTGSEDGSIIVWDAASGTVLERLLGHASRVLGLAFSADGRTLWSCSLDGAIFEWDMGTDRRFGRSFGVPNPGGNPPPDVPQTPPLALSPDGTQFAIRSGRSAVVVRSTTSAKTVQQFRVPGTGGDVTAIAWGRSGLLAIGGHNGYVGLWTLSPSPHAVRARKGLAPTNGQPEAVQALAFSPDGTLLAAGDVNHTPGATPYRLGRVAVWDETTGKLLWRTSRHADVHVLAFSRDGRTVAAGYDDSHVVLFDSRTGRMQRNLQEVDGGPSGVLALGFSPDGSLAAGDWAGIVRVWNARTGTPIGQLTLVHPAPVASLDFDPAGDIFATTGGSDGLARLWSAQTRRQFGATFPSDRGHWGAAMYTPDGSELVVAYDDGSGYVWPTDPRVWEEHACAVAGRNFTHEEWRRFVGGHSYTRVCRQFPAGT